ncbi:MAG TPA: hypothetical protein VHC63_14525 [Acidimicrobiales bacterium]|nr:hypothetical protein [Acidimicrobiales bacterium]
MESHPRHTALHRSGVALVALGLILVILALIVPKAGASAVPHVFQGDCVGTSSGGVCVLDEPAGKNPAVHGIVTYLRSATPMSFDIQANDKVTEVQICMQASGPFAVGANVCAGVHGHHVSYSQSGTLYTVDLVKAGYSKTSPLYWTLHVIAGRRTLQVRGACHPPEPPTTTTTSTSTTSTSTPSSTTTAAPTTTTSTTMHPSTTTTAAPGTTTTSVAPTTTTVPATTTSVAPTSTTAVPATTSSIAPATSTTIAPTTSTTIAVLGSNLARTGGPRWWTFLLGASLLLIGATLVVSAQILHPRNFTA